MPRPAHGRRNNFYQLWSVSLVDLAGGLSARAKAMFCGALIGSVANYLLIILVGSHDELAPLS